MSAFNFASLIVKQSEIDALIAQNHHISYASTRSRRTVALLVEIGEFANATRCFKYWSNKPSEAKEIVLDEYADGLHFFLSLGIDIGSKKQIYEVKDNKIPLSDQIVKLYCYIANFTKHYDKVSYSRAFSYFLNMSYTLGYSVEEVIKAYETKLKENYRRQRTNY